MYDSRFFLSVPRNRFVDYLLFTVCPIRSIYFKFKFFPFSTSAKSWFSAEGLNEMVRKLQSNVKIVKSKERKIKRDDDKNKKITDFFAVRRSERTVSKLLKQFENEETERAIIEGDESHLYVCLFEGKGRGVRTGRKLRRGEFVVEYKGELLERHAGLHREKIYSLDENIGCYMYYFDYGGKQYCVDATAETPYLGRLVNHSYKKPNCATKVVEVGGVPRLILTALRVIDVDEELLYNYGERDKEVIAANPWLVNS